MKKALFLLFFCANIHSMEIANVIGYAVVGYSLGVVLKVIKVKQIQNQLMQLDENKVSFNEALNIVNKSFNIVPNFPIYACTTGSLLVWLINYREAMLPELSYKP